jgi:hypothetical protein
VSSYTKMIDVQEDQPIDQASPTKNVGTLSTDINSYYSSGPTVGEDDMDDPWEETHSETEQVGGNGAEGTLDPEHHNIGNNEGQHGGSNHDEVLEGAEDSEYEDKFHCRPRYQHTRVDVRFIKITFYSIHSSFLKARMNYKIVF